MCARWRTFTPRKGNDGYHEVFIYGKAPTRQLHGTPIAVDRSGHTRKLTSSFDAVIYVQVRLTKRILVGCSSGQSPSMPLHAIRRKSHGSLRAWCKQYLVWSVKPRRAPSRHCRNGRAYGHTITAMHDTPPPPCLPDW